MTRHKDLKARIRARMARTGERYATARHQILAARPGEPSDTDAPTWRAGSIPKPRSWGACSTPTASTAPMASR